MCISFIYSYTEQPPKRDADKVLVNGHMLGKDLLLPRFFAVPPNEREVSIGKSSRNGSVSMGNSSINGGFHGKFIDFYA